MMKKSWIIVFLVLLTTVMGMADVQMPAIFSEHMVLQQGKEVHIWGKAAPGEQVTVSIKNSNIESSCIAKTKANGKWSTSLPGMKAGGPCTLIIQGQNTITYNDVMIGEVWLCSGQSNMEMPLAGWPNQPVEGSTEAIQAADYPLLRLFTVKKKISPTPLDDCEGEWAVCTPKLAAEFTATGFFFGRKLLQELDIPIGLIHSSWGGTPAEAWTDSESLEQMEEFRPELERIKNIAQLTPDSAAVYQSELAQWQSTLFEKTTEANSKEWLTDSFLDTDWPQIDLPQKWSAIELNGFQGSACFRKTIDILADWAGNELIMELGPIDDMDVTFFNGEKIGQTDGWSQNRVYTIAGAAVKAGTAVVLIDVINPMGEGGLVGEKEALKLYPKNSPEKAITLSGTWRYQKGLPADQLPPQPQNPQDLNAGTPTVLYNGMIHPLVPFSLRGAIWYQGESNTSNPKLYRRLFPAMIQNWRHVFQQKDFPFYFDQIAPFNYGSGTAGVEIREVQRESLAKVKNSGMAVLMDKTTLDNIHPPYKKEAGERMALWALAKDYEKDIVYSGPLYKNMKVDGNRIRVNFDHVGKGLDSQGKPLSGFQIAGTDNVFHDAKAEIMGNSVVVSSPEVSAPIAVRYAWDNQATASLFNKEGLSASSFRTDEW